MKHSRVDFAALCGITPGNLHNYITRGKVIVVGGLVDDENEQNAFFLKKRQSGGKVAVDTKVAHPAKKVKESKATTSKKPKAEKKERIPAGMLDVEKARRQTDLMDLEQDRKKAEIERIKSTSEMLKMKQGRYLGEYLPTVEVNMLFNQHFRALVMSFKDGVDRFLVEIAQKAKLGVNDVAALRKEMISMINKSVDRATEVTDRELEKMADNSNKRAA